MFRIQRQAKVRRSNTNRDNALKAKASARARLARKKELKAQKDARVQIAKKQAFVAEKRESQRGSSNYVPPGPSDQVLK